MMLTTLLALFYGFFSFVKGDTTYCYNEDSCEDEDISTTTCDCYGYYGCEGANITSDYTYSFGAYSNYEGYSDDEYIWSYGLLANYYGDIETYAIYAYGYLSAYEATISPLSNTLYAYFYGYYSGYYADILCYSGDTCRVYCGSSYGCADLDFYCYSGAYCYYDCANDTDYCPTLYSGVDSTVEYVTGLDEIEEKLKINHVEGLSDEQIRDYHQRDNEISDEKRGKENIEELVSGLVKVANRPGYAKLVATPQLNVDSVSQHIERLNAKQNDKESLFYQYENYGYAMLIDGAVLLALLGAYKCLRKKSNKDDVIFDSEDTPLVKQ